MNCAWQAYLNLLPQWMRDTVDKQGRENLQELRLRLGRPAELILKDSTKWLNHPTSEKDLISVVNAASTFSPWTAESVRRGYITAEGGHRIGICGEVALVNGEIRSIPKLTSVSLRVARDMPGIAEKAAGLKGSSLIIGSPGAGKTTLLRDMVRQISTSRNCCVAVVDERQEIFPLEKGKFSFDPGARTDVLSGCGKKEGIEMVLRCMNPKIIAMDEITAEVDCQALIYAAWCGVSLMATAHALDQQDFSSRPVYKPLLEKGIFQNLIVMQKDQTWQLERISG